VHELQVPDATLVRFLKPFELAIKEVEPFNIGDDSRPPGVMGCLQIAGGKGAAQTVVGDDFIHPGETLEMVTVELARLGCSHRGERACFIPGKDRTVRYVGEAGRRQRSRPHRLGQM